MELAEKLADAIAEAHPDDARQILTAALIDLSGGRLPSHYFMNVREEAELWATIAPPADLCAVLEAALARLRDRALHLRMRKELFMILWRSFGKDEQSRFLAFAQGEV